MEAESPCSLQIVDLAQGNDFKGAIDDETPSGMHSPKRPYLNLSTKHALELAEIDSGISDSPDDTNTLANGYH
jgi:hypothetical protein